MHILMGSHHLCLHAVPVRISTFARLVFFDGCLHYCFIRLQYRYPRAGQKTSIHRLSQLQNIRFGVAIIDGENNKAMLFMFIMSDFEPAMKSRSFCAPDQNRDLAVLAKQEAPKRTDSGVSQLTINSENG